jgi:pilus assembly protein CpaB
MKFRGFLMLVLSLVLAGVAAIYANRWMSERLAAADANKTGELTGVVAAAADIPFGTRIDASLVKMVQIPPQFVPPGAFTDPQAVFGRIAGFALYQGEVLLENRVVEHIGGSTLAAVVPEGKRAITVRVDDVVGVAGFLLPANRVDMIATRNSRDGTQSRTLLENLKVLAVDQSTSTDKNEPVIVRAVTLEVDPSQAEEIVRAQSDGRVQFTLRNPLDGIRREPEPEPEAPAVAEKPAPPPVVINRTVVVEVIRGTSQSATTFGGAQQQPAAIDFAR